ncbi:hypothetical protein MIR68_007077 [Amoeboaphelidium protococcarum]|nr:hypothetical protein MIR68_007077 [Amoeboaphelidium protococcarum]
MSDVDKYFTKQLTVATGNDGGDQFKCYVNTKPPAQQLKEGERVPLFICHHGAGSSALSFATMSLALMNNLSYGEVFCFDARGHGDSVNSGPLELQQLTDDAIAIVSAVYSPEQMKQYDVILVGHSMGAPVMVQVALQSGWRNVIGIVMIDVVEGTALDAIRYMKSYIQTRPSKFHNINEAVEWSISHGMTRNKKQAEVSMPSLLIKQDSGEFKWRTDLSATEPFWIQWFTGLSDNFLRVKAAKLLIIANTDRLDKTLTIAQIQGKFQMTILTNVGHYVHEDKPEETARVLVEFWKRNSRIILPPKVGSLPLRH